MNKVIAYTDGACQGNPGRGGWGVILMCGDAKKELSGFEELTTNNRMELKAAVTALSNLKIPCEITIHTDSLYVKNGFEKWMVSWKVNGWVNAQKQPVKNKDLWEELDSEAQRHNVSFMWVKGHSGDRFNEEADSLAKRAIDSTNRNR